MLTTKQVKIQTLNSEMASNRAASLWDIIAVVPEVAATGTWPFLFFYAYNLTEALHFP